MIALLVSWAKKTSTGVLCDLIYSLLVPKTESLFGSIFQCCACLTGKDNHHQGSHGDGAQVNGIQPEEISRLREEVEELKSQQGLLQSQLAEKDSLIENLVSRC